MQQHVEPTEGVRQLLEIHMMPEIAPLQSADCSLSQTDSVGDDNSLLQEAAFVRHEQTSEVQSALQLSHSPSQQPN